MEKLVDAGLVKALGLSNFNIEQVKRVWDAARIKPTNNQVIDTVIIINCCQYTEQGKRNLNN